MPVTFGSLIIETAFPDLSDMPTSRATAAEPLFRPSARSATVEEEVGGGGRRCLRALCEAMPRQFGVTFSCGGSESLGYDVTGYPV